jgi:protein TonB
VALKKNPKVDLKRQYKRTFEICMIISLVILVSAFKFFPKFTTDLVDLEAPQELVDMQDVEQTKQEAAPPPPPKPPIPIEAPTDDVLEDIEIADTELDLDEVITAPPPPPVEEDEGEPVFFVAVEQMPEPIGGIGAIQSKIVYPEIAKRAGVQGRVFVKAFVDESGNVNKVELLRGIGAGCDEAAMAAVQQTMFKPGKQRGKPVNVQVTVPVLFKLQ